MIFFDNRKAEAELIGDLRCIHLLRNISVLLLCPYRALDMNPIYEKDR